jgi:predicted DNA-binding transcriptional regulator AlpA
MEKILRLPAVIAATGHPESSIYRLMREGAFPRPVKLRPGGRAVGWTESAIKKVVAERDAKSSA